MTLYNGSKIHNQIQNDELKTLQSIYNDDLLVINEVEPIFEIKLQLQEKSGTLHFSLPNEYPDSPPICEIGIPWLRGVEKQKLEYLIQNLVYENMGVPIIFQIVEGIREELHEILKPQDINKNLFEDHIISSNAIKEDLFNVFHGEPFIDRKSTFQAHVSHVKSEDEILMIKRQLLLNNKIATATHNISAYRLKISTANGVSKLIQSCDDDGENKAGERLLNMMVLMGVENIYVVVSRWFGGIKLGPDRFKHINNTAKDAIIKCGWFPSKH